MTATFLYRKAMRPAGLAVLGLSVALPVWAQTSPAVTPPAAMQAEEQANWKNEKFERQELREEMESIRKEHDELEAAGDRLVDQCVNVSGAQATACEAQKQVLHERREKLHERRQALREKIETLRKEHPTAQMGGGPMGGVGAKPWPHMTNAPATAPAVTVPAAPPAQLPPVQ